MIARRRALAAPYAPLAAALLLAGCVPPQPPTPPDSIQAIAFKDIPGWSVDSLAQTLPAFWAECRRLGQLPAETGLGGQGLAATYGGKAGQWSVPCTAAANLDIRDETGARHFYETWFQAYRVTAPGLFTGYYEPEVKGSLTRTGPFQTPLLARPTDLMQSTPPPGDANAQPVEARLEGGKMVPYWSRADIEAGRIGTAARPLFWLQDPIDLFFLQIQGAGRIRLPDGSVLRVGYDGKNGRPYTPIGRVLVERNALAPQDVNMPTIRAWLAAHPTDAKSVMDRNDDYVFFRVITDADNGSGPPGTLGVNLVPGRTAAVDRHYIPLATPVFVDTTDPLTNTPWRRLLMAQDLGTDIKGPARTDIFLGSGALAEQQAGRMRQAGSEYILLPRPAS